MPFRCRKRGGLLPRLFTLTRRMPGSVFSVALSVAGNLHFRRPAVSRRHFRRSPDFPHPENKFPGAVSTTLCLISVPAD